MAVRVGLMILVAWTALAIPVALPIGRVLTSADRPVADEAAPVFAVDAARRASFRARNAPGRWRRCSSSSSSPASSTRLHGCPCSERPRGQRRAR